MDKKSTIVLIAVVVIALLALGVYYATNRELGSAANSGNVIDQYNEALKNHEPFLLMFTGAT
ncbi:hypothetical protein ciss_21890 [Carboxydothermus islandicus]|uniref:Uncharacterized protein n=1 Tax=Carboxydothermus islandicus TaxID=661089 RepID=A0A1L8D4X6_9THEO|nr:hypothetical protein [Carboxydothermus islandicus]GAV26256.1 hypothetical protein ciss_21890 [Carboxydothermus islandicus]